MIHGVSVILKTGIAIVNKGFEEGKDLLPKFLSVLTRMAENLGLSRVKKSSFMNYEIYVVTSEKNPNIALGILCDKSDNAAFQRAKILAYKLDQIIPAQIDAITDDLRSKIEEIVDGFFKEQVDLPDFKIVTDLAKVIYGGIPGKKLKVFEKRFEEFYKKEKERGEKMIYVPETVQINDERKALKEALSLVSQWNLYKATDFLSSLYEASTDFKELAAFLLVRLSLLSRTFPRQYPVISATDVAEIIKADKFPGNMSLPCKFVKMEFAGESVDKIIDFLKKSSREIISDFNKIDDDVLKQAYLILLFTINDEIVNSTLLGNFLANELKDRSEIMYEQIRCLKELRKLYQFSPITSWFDIQKVFSDSKLLFMRTDESMPRMIYHKSLPTKLLATILKTKKVGTADKVSTLSMLRAIPLLLSAILVIESPDVTIKDKHAIIREAYELLSERLIDIPTSRPLLDVIFYFNYYQLALHLLYYLLYLEEGEAKKEILMKGYELGLDGVRYFIRMLINKRISMRDFLVYISPIIFVLSRISIELDKIPDEIIEFARLLTLMDENYVEELSKKKDLDYFAVLINALMALIATLKMIEIPKIIKEVLAQIINVLDSISRWAIYNGVFSREIADIIYSAAKLAISTNNKELAWNLIQMLVKYGKVLCWDIQENTFDAVITLEKIGELMISLIERFGETPEIVVLIQDSLTKAKHIWVSEEYIAKVAKINDLLSKVLSHAKH
ncbi:MAG: hypothetical protein ACTSX9_04770 [Candidatus Njordarchaeales archaeon]